MDFNFTIYQELLKALQSQGFLFQTVSAYAEAKVKNEVKFKGEPAQPGLVSDGGRTTVVERRWSSDGGRAVPIAIGTRPAETSRDQPGPAEAQPQPVILLRHDVEARYGNALKLAQLQHGLGIKGTYYFRIYPHKDNEAVIRKIVALGHEIGYHYDDLTECRGDYEKAIRRFQKNLEYLRQFGPVTTATMEGAPLSGYDNRDLWAVRPFFSVPRPPSPAPSSASLAPRPHFHYRDFGIKTEPYFDIDFSEFFYLTDTGRRWDGWKFSVRDKIPLHQDRWIQQGLVFRGTGEIIKAARAGALPARIMITVHPQRWNDKLLPWLKEFIWQNIKNQVKRVLVKERV